MYLIKINTNTEPKERIKTTNESIKKKDNLFLNVEDKNINTKNKTISQIKNIYQPKNESKNENDEIKINEFDDLINLCNIKKEIKLKYELENNVNLVSFENERIEISFNENLDKYFVKKISEKLFEWTKKRWIITFSKKIGLPSKKQIIKEEKGDLLKIAKQSIEYKEITETFPDAKLIEVKVEKKND